jgi:hypothetical protein
MVATKLGAMFLMTDPVQLASHRHIDISVRSAAWPLCNIQIGSADALTVLLATCRRVAEFNINDKGFCRTLTSASREHSPAAALDHAAQGLASDRLSRPATRKKMGNASRFRVS